MASEGILVNGVTEILKKLVPVISQQISQAWGVKDDLRKLGETLESIQALISDAEEKQITDAPVRLWLRRLKDVVYDADDVMDEFCHESMRLCERGSQIKHKVRRFMSKSSNPLVFQIKMASKIRAIKKSLDEIYSDQVRYSLNATGGTSQVDLIRVQHNRLTTSVVDDSVLIGRKDAKLEIVKMLTNKIQPSMSPSSSSSHKSSLHEQLSVVSIVGMGGLGKTSLAQLVYKDESVIKHFEQKIWVCVSDKFDVYKILTEIIESITGVSCGDLSNVDVLATQVKGKLSGNKYLLVLDDVWNEDAEDWEKLKGVLVNGVGGSTLLVTTRSQNVASVIGGKVHHLEKLTDDICWSIMQKKMSFLLPQNMIIVGRDIAKKCDGLPLAANFLGSLLHLKREERDWVSINEDNNLWVQPENTRVISILKLSYDNLTSALKQCFSYCCLFPKDWEIRREILIRMWIAEGFIQLSNEVNNRSFEDIGNDYFEFLLWNSFFQDVEKDELGVIYKCKMHDLVHDLAISVTDRNEFGIFGKEDVSQVRRLQLICDNESSTTTAQVLCKAEKLRTVIVLHPNYCSQASSFSSAERLRILYPLGLWGKYFSFSTRKFKHLRFLDLSGCEFDLSHDVSLNHSHNLQTLILRSCQNVSGFIGEIKRLRNLKHLDVSYSDIKVLHDDCIVNLTNLQTLDLSGCRQLKALPENIGLLKHLRYLDFSYSRITKIPDSITSISNLVTLNFSECENLDALPTELGALTQLRCLDLSETNIKVLPESCISSLCNLEIMNFGIKCELPREIKNWPKLRQFRCRDYKVMPRGMEKLTCLETLDSYTVRRDEDNTWNGHSGIEELAVLNSLRVLKISRLYNVRGGIEDAERAKLKDKPNLRELYLDSGVYVDDDLVLEGLRPHPNLRKLEIVRSSGFNLPKWMGSSPCLLPNLVSLELKFCNRCEKLPALGMLPCLRDLTIDTMYSVKCLGREFYYQQRKRDFITRSSLFHFPWLGSTDLQKSTTTRSSLFPSLVSLEISTMENLEEWVSPPPPSSNFRVDSFPLLEKLIIRGCLELRSAPNSFPSLKELKLSEINFKAVNSILLSASRQGRCLSSLTSIVICNSPELIYFSLGVLLQNNTPNLHSLSIFNCSEFQGFRDEDDNLNYNNIDSSLRKLELVSCPALTSLPDLRSWSSLRELTIFKCDKLNRESIPYDLKTSLSFLDSLKVDFIQREDPQLKDPTNSIYSLINLLKK